MNDLISRSAAITAIQKAYTDTEGGTDKPAVWKNIGLTKALHIMQDVPSAQLEIIRCKDCKHWEQDSICDGHCLEIDLHHVDEDHYCSYAERREE